VLSESYSLVVALALPVTKERVTQLGAQGARGTAYRRGWTVVPPARPWLGSSSPRRILILIKVAVCLTLIVARRTFRLPEDSSNM
jgi:hypothetical protein